MGIPLNYVELGFRAFSLKDLPVCEVVIKLLVLLNKAVQLPTAILIELAFKIIYRPSCAGEVETHHLKLVGKPCWIFSDPQPAEQLLEAIFHIDIVICLHHAKEQALAEAARANHEQIAVLLLEQREIHGFVDIVQVVAPDALEVGYSVRQLFHFCQI